MIYNYSLFDPTGNITVLVTTPTPVCDQPRVAEAVMANEPTAQQAGFVGTDENGTPTLRMAGGEFCGNASLSAATFFCMQRNLPAGKSETLHMRVSGVSRTVPVTVTNLGNGNYSGTVLMPTPLAVAPCTLHGQSRDYHGTLVTMSGISHFVTEEPMEPKEAEANIKQWFKEIKADGLGIMLLQKESLTVRPLVYVPVPETMFWESSCASGSTAVTAALVQEQQKPFSVTLHEPSGCLTVAVNEQGEFRLSGNIKQIKEDSFIE